MNPSPLTPLERERLIKEFSEMFPSAPFLATESKIFSWFISKIEEQKEQESEKLETKLKPKYMNDVYTWKQIEDALK